MLAALWPRPILGKSPDTCKPHQGLQPGARGFARPVFPDEHRNGGKEHEKADFPAALPGAADGLYGYPGDCRGSGRGYRDRRRGRRRPVRRAGGRGPGRAEGHRAGDDRQDRRRAQLHQRLHVRRGHHHPEGGRHRGYRRVLCGGYHQQRRRLRRPAERGAHPRVRERGRADLRLAVRERPEGLQVLHGPHDRRARRVRPGARALLHPAHLQGQPEGPGELQVRRARGARYPREGRRPHRGEAEHQGREACGQRQGPGADRRHRGRRQLHREEGRHHGDRRLFRQRQADGAVCAQRRALSGRRRGGRGRQRPAHDAGGGRWPDRHGRHPDLPDGPGEPRQPEDRLHRLHLHLEDRRHRRQPEWRALLQRDREQPVHPRGGARGAAERRPVRHLHRQDRRGSAREQRRILL